MADYTYYTEITRRRVYVLSLPTNRAELYKALSGASNDWSRQNPGKEIFDDSLLIESDGEMLTISFEVEKNRTVEK